MLPVKKKKKPDYLGVTANTEPIRSANISAALKPMDFSSPTANLKPMDVKSSIGANMKPMDFSSKTKAVAVLRSAKKGVKQAKMETAKGDEPAGKVTDPKGFLINRKGDEYEKTDSKREEYLERLRKRK